jgi:hypothetical protein
MNLQETAPHTFQLPPAVLQQPVPEFWGKKIPVSIQYSVNNDYCFSEINLS